jgi:hypothetical protein
MAPKTGAFVPDRDRSKPVKPTILLLSLPLALAAPPAAAQGSGDRDPTALAALDRMGAALRLRQAINVHADVTAEDALTTGEKLQYAGTVDIVARRPSAMKLAMRMGASERTLYFDGTTLTMAAPELHYYASVAAPGTIAEMLRMADERYGIEVPLADLFAWGTDPSSAAKLTSAFAAGSEQINGQTCDHYAIRQPGVDWQVWIRQGENALPCKLVITTRADASLPQYTAVYRWSDEPPPESGYAYDPPADAKAIAMHTLDRSKLQPGR